MAEKTPSIITKKVVIIALALGISLCIFTLIVQYLIFPNLIIEPKEKIKIKITPVSATSTSQGQPSDLTGGQAETEMPSMTGVIALGMTIKVTGTGNEGLRMRSGAGIDQTTLYLAQEGELFKIIEGPIILDSLIWWKIEGLDDPGKSGWSVQDYMTIN